MTLTELAITLAVASTFALVQVTRARVAVQVGDDLTTQLQRAERERDRVEEQVRRAAWNHRGGD